MKKITMPSMFALVLFASATLSLADQPRLSYEHLKTLKWQIGDWRAEFVIEDIPEHASAGAKAVSLASHKWIADKAFIQSDFTKLVDGEAVGTGREFTLWNYRTSQMEQTFIVSTQFSGSGVWAQDDNAYTLSRRQRKRNGSSRATTTVPKERSIERHSSEEPVRTNSSHTSKTRSTAKNCRSWKRRGRGNVSR